MIKEAYCSFEVSKLLREKGFDEPCKSYFTDEADYYDCTYVYDEITDINLGVFEYLRPTHQMAMAWLREKGVYMSIDSIISSSRNVYYSIDVYTEESGWKHIVDLYTSYEEAVEAALKICIENLI